MKIANIALFIGALAAGLSAGRAPAQAQSPATPIKTEGDDKPWNRGVPLADRDAARDLFLEGNRLFNIPLYTRAAEKYIAALGKWNHPAFHFNLALTQLNLGQQVEAHQNLEQALKHGEEPLGPDRFQEAQRQLQELEHQLARTRITCPTNGAEVTLDGSPLFTGPGNYEGWVTANAHEITAKKPDYLPQARRFTVASGEFKNIELRLVTLGEAADSGRRWVVWKPWAVITTGITVAAGSGVIHTLAARNFSNYDNQFEQKSCAVLHGCTPQDLGDKLNTQLKRAMQEQRIAVGGYIAAGSVIAAGMMLLYINRPHLPEQKPATTPVNQVAIMPTISMNTFGVFATITE